MKAKKLIPMALSAAMVLSMAATPAFAASANSNSEENVVTETFTDHADGTEAVQVYATVASTYTVTIPKTITLDGASKEADYLITVSGDIADDEVVTVAPAANTFAMKSTTGGGKADIDATITQDKSTWAWNEFDTKANGNISAPLTAGQWNGTFNFNISLDEKEAAPEVKTFNISIKTPSGFAIPSVTINNVQEGWTWQDAIDNGYSITESEGAIINFGLRIQLDGVDVKPTDTIIEGGNYSCVEV